MAFRRNPDDLPGNVPACSLRFIDRRPEADLVEETEAPALDVYETPEAFVIEAEVPGVDPARIEVTAGDGAIVIEGVKDDVLEPGRVNFLCMERAFGAFRRVVSFARAVDLNRVTAASRDGVLQILVPKLEEKRGRRRVIPVTAEPPDERSEP